MADWKPDRYLIDQGRDPKVEVEGYTKDGLGVHHHTLIADAWVITHLNSGLRVMEVYGDSFEDVLIYLNEVVRSADWTSLVKSDPKNPAHQALALRCTQIRNTNFSDHEDRLRAQQSGALTGGHLQ
nr:hypothetical protein [uncultured Acidocella sp.]